MSLRPSLLLILGVACNSENDIKRVNEAPLVAISAPGPASLFRQGPTLIGVVGTVGDSYDKPTDLGVSWVLDEGEAQPAVVAADGTVTLDLDTYALELGEHRVALYAVDSDDAASEAHVDFILDGPLGPPLVSITSPENGTVFTPGEAAYFEGGAVDATTPDDELVFAWSSSLDGELFGAISGGGASSLFTTGLTLGEHLVTLTVTDGDGEIGQDTVTVIVAEPVEEPVEEEDPEPEPGDLIFSEFMVNPSTPPVADEDGEWVELYNTSGRTLDINGYSFHDDAADYWIFESSVTVEPHGYMVLCANLDPEKNGGVACDGWFFRNPAGDKPPESLGHGSGVAIANNDDELVLTGPDGIDIDVFDYNDTSSDPIEAGFGFGLDPDRLDGELNNDIDNWCVQTTLLDGATDPGTPGLPNDPCF